MPTNEDFNFSGMDWRDLSPEQQAEYRQAAVQRARRLRTQAIREMLQKLAAAPTKGMAYIARSIRNRRARLREARSEQMAIAQLQSLDDHALKDLGIRRSEIESVVHMHDDDRSRIDRNKHAA